MKRFSFLFGILFFLMLFLFCGCGSNNGSSSDDDVAGDDDFSDDDAADDDAADDDAADDDDDDNDDSTPPIEGCKVKDYGAVGDGETLDTDAIQSAIDDCAAQGGGYVIFEPGNYYSGTIYFRTGITLYLMEEATLLGSKNKEDYSEEEALLYAESLHDIGIAGPGTIDGNGQYWWPFGVLGLWRPARLIKIVGSQNVLIQEVHLTQSPKWTLHLLACDSVLIDGITIRNPAGGSLIDPNTDGIDLEACRTVEVKNCDIETGDDCIVLKNGDDEWRRESYDIDVHDCTLAGWANAFKIGTETERDFYNITFRDSTVQATVDSIPGTRNISAITLISDDGANLHDILISNIHVKAVQAPFFIRLQRRLRGDLTEPGTITNIHLKDITVDDASLTASIQGIPGYNIDTVTLENISIVSSEGGTLAQREIVVPERETDYPDATFFGTYPAYGIYARHVNGCLSYTGEISITSSNGDGRPEIVYDDVFQVEDSIVPGAYWVYDRTGNVIPCSE